MHQDEKKAPFKRPREPLMEKMRTRLSTPEGRSKYQKRKAIVEPVFGDLKHNRRHGFPSPQGKEKGLGRVSPHVHSPQPEKDMPAPKGGKGYP